MSGKGAASEAGPGGDPVDEMLDLELGHEVPVLPSSSPPSPSSPKPVVTELAVPSAGSSSPHLLANMIGAFSARTGIQDPTRCAALLAANHWDLGAALSRFSNDADEVLAAGFPGPLSAPPMGTPVRPLSSRLPMAPLAWNLATLPFKVIGGGVDMLVSFLRLGGWAAASVLYSLGLLRRTPRDLPSAIVLEIARHLRPSLRDIWNARSVCQVWRVSIPSPNALWLVLSRPAAAAGAQKIRTLQILAPGGGADPCMSVVPTISPPPDHTTCWGADHGLLALRQIGTNHVYLHCIVCGESSMLPPLPGGMMTPCGFFYNEHLLNSLATLSSAELHSTLHFEQIDWEAANPPSWEVYPGTNGEIMSSVTFAAGLRFVGVTADRVLLVDELGGPAGQNMIALNVPDVDNQHLVAWGANQCLHVFSCAEKVYLCALFRAHYDISVVSIAVFVLQQDPGAGYQLLRTRDVGNFSVYLGANKALVLPSVEGSFVRRPNTIYITDDDGIVRDGRVLVIGISSDEVVAVPFPAGIAINDYGRAAWVAAAPPGGPINHCNN